MTAELQNIEWFQKQLLDWAKNNLRDYPWRETTDPYFILVAEFLLQRTDADKVKPIYEAFLARYTMVDKLAMADILDISELLQPLGLFFRAERLLRTVNIIKDRYGGKIPQEEKELLKLPGIGKYTARAILSQAFDKPAAVLDTNVVRIIERFFGITGGKVKSRCNILWSAADTVAPDREVGRWNLTLLDFGAKICTARNPDCDVCPLYQRCCWVR
jgi:A/G-specific adenine glycosylase